MGGKVIAAALSSLAVGFLVLAFVPTAATSPGRAVPSAQRAPTGGAPLSQAVVIHDRFFRPDAGQAEGSSVIARMLAATVGTPPGAASRAVTNRLVAHVFNHDTVGLPQNEESVTVCGHTVLGGTNDFRGLLLTPPQEPAAGWHLSTDGGSSVRNEGLLPPVTIAGQSVAALGDPVDVAGQRCSLYASSVNSTADDSDRRLPQQPGQAGDLPREHRRHVLADPPRRGDSRAAALPRQGVDGRRPERIGRRGGWVSFTDFTRDATGAPLGSSVKAVRCNPALTTCTQPILVSGSDRRTQFSDLTVGPDGRTYVSWVDFGGSPETGDVTMTIKLRVAPPGSTLFGPTRIVAIETEPMVGVLHANSFVTGATTIPKNSVKMVNGRPEMFVVWENCLARPFGVLCEEPRINLARSEDSGASWQRTVLSVGGDNYYPTISENRGGPTVAVAWYTNRHDRLFHSRQDVELASVDPTTGAVVKRQRLTPVSNEATADPVLLGQFIGDYFEVFAQAGVAYVHYNANYRFVRLVGQGLPIPQQDNYLTKAHL